jgi:hypothetical protein
VKTLSTVAPILEPSRSTIQHCWPSWNGPRAITLSNTPSAVARIVEHFGADRFRLAEVGQQRQLVIDFGFLH